ncbi:uncharacterized protein Z519_06553 [Cladophialophora bantiana CBS 173.52]|uniref:BZIP domain-containing protein n=1 Tax=Cladophialophora bantiana (strain ATCC 10958 / CBS 173.52 / CDC B-1940 / NIH 8579) TaxID=1442370 RepID=A0A0D2ES05_CLAB1|nr:uncharacterized protein Z519_06553 [Cladophialophora bantiana CBS 173.52]KIW92706.1 hypothetical protein Z519_06553 [Cladophialophora bantiana CBS 173.52]
MFANINNPTVEFLQSAHDTVRRFGGPQDVDIAGHSNSVPCLDQPDLKYGAFPMMSVPDQGNGTPSSPECVLASFEPVSTIATRNERRKAQNRAAQRAFRVRQQQALTDAHSKLRSLQEELEEATGKKDHFERLYKSLSREHERLLRTFQELLVSVQST